MSTNYDFVLEYVYSDAFKQGTDAYNKLHRHGALSYRYNILYSYNLPIAIKVWYKGTQYLVATVGRGCSCTTSRHIYILNNNMWRAYNASQIISVYNVGDIVLNNTLNHSEYKHELKRWLNRGHTDIQLCDNDVRQSLVDRMNTARALSVFDSAYDKIAAEYEKRYSVVDSQSKRTKIRNAAKKKAQVDAQNAVDALSTNILNSEDIIFDILAATVDKHSVDTRVSNLFAEISSPFITVLKTNFSCCSDITYALSRRIGHKIWFSLPSNGILPDAIICVKYVVDGDYGGCTCFKLKTLFDHFVEDPEIMFELGNWDNVSDSGSYYKMDEGKAQVTRVDEHDYLFRMTENNRLIREYHLCESAMQLLHHFVSTCREKLGKIAYRTGEKHGRRRSSTGQSESSGSSE